MAKEIIKLFRIDDTNGSVSLEIEVTGNRYLLETWPSQADFLNADREWASHNYLAAGRLAYLAYLAVDPTGSNPSLLTDVVTEIDPAALTIVRRVA